MFSVKKGKNMIKIGICDDDLRAAGETQQYLDELGKKYGYRLEMDVYASGEELIREYQEGAGFDLIYLDIEMKQRD